MIVSHCRLVSDRFEENATRRTTMKNFKANGKAVPKILYAFIIWTVFFYLFPLECKIYEDLFIGIWALLFIFYGKEENREFLEEMLSMTAGNGGAYVFVKLVKGSTWAGVDSMEMILSLICGAEFLYGAYLVWRGRCWEAKAGKEKEEEEVKKAKPRIFSSRQYDLERVRDTVIRVDIAGIHSSWGNGKTFVVDRLCEDEEIRRQFEVIRIDLLTCNLDEIAVILMKELEKILSRNGIFSRNSRLARRMLEKNSILGEIRNLFSLGGSEELSAALGEFKNDVKKLEKKILIIYEDLDRIEKEEVIKKIFSISEKLSGEEIHILYQFEQRELEKKGMDREFVEKYIPFVVNLTELKYEVIVRGLWDQLEMGKAGIDEKELLELSYGSIRSFEAERALGVGLTGSLETLGVPVRKVQIFMNELKNVVCENEVYRDKENRKTAIAFLFIKNFYYPYYEKLQIGKRVTELLTFHWKDGEYTMEELIRERREERITQAEVRELLSVKENRDVYFILALLDYSFETEDEGEVSRESIANRPIEIQKREQKAEKKDRLIWNLMANGTSELTDMEAAAGDLVRDVLAPDILDKEKAWEEYWNNLYDGKRAKDNRTIFRWGIDNFLSVFQSFRGAGRTEEEWLMLLEFYGQMQRKKGITVEMVECLNYCDVYKQKVFLKAMELFCDSRIRGNMNQQRGYRIFLKTYFAMIGYFGYSDSYVFETWRVRMEQSGEEDIGELDKMFAYMENVIEKEKKKVQEFGMEKAVREYEIILEFIGKNREVIKREEAIKPEEVRPHVDMRSVRQNQEEFDRLLTYLDDREVFIEEVRKSYGEGKLNPGELRELLDKAR